MANLFQKLKTLSYDKSILSSDVLVSAIADTPYEVKILFYKKGTEIPPHTHSSNTQHIILSGKLKIHLSGEKEPQVLTALGDYKCGGWEYRGLAMADSYVMLIQEPGTKFIKSKK